MKYFASILPIIFFATAVSAQITPTPEAAELKSQWPVLEGSPNYFEIRKQYLEYLNSLEIDGGLLGLDFETDELLDKFMRWDYLMRTRVDAEGNFPHPYTVFKEFEKYKKTHPGSFSEGSRSASWEPVGTAMVPDNGGGAGRVNCLIFDPIDHNTFYCGTAGGGLWKLPSGGASWIPLTDALPVISIADVAVDPTNNSIIYIATGDGYGYEADWQSDNDFWGGVYSAGILKTTDGGATWNPTGLSYEQDELTIVQRILINPENTNVLLAATRNGIFKSTNGGNTWNLVSDVHCYDFAMNTVNSNIIYAVGDRDVIKSEDFGGTWTIIQDNLADYDDRMSIETTADNPDVIYVFAVPAAIFVSTNGGVSFSIKPTPDDVNDYNGYYDNVLEVSDLNSDLLFTGGVDIARSVNGASTWQRKTDWWAWPSFNYVHADQKTILCDPLNENIVYAANDGGVFKSSDKGQTWSDMSNGLRIAQPYRVSTSFTVPGKVLSGWQDNGCNLWDDDTWDRVQGGDGMEVIIDYTDANRMYASYQFGSINKTLNGGATWNPLPVAGGGWLTPYVLDPVNPAVMYYGTYVGTIQKSTNGGTSFSTKFPGLVGPVFDIRVAPSNTNYVYACALDIIKVSTNGGDTWTDITAGLPHSGIGFNYIAVSDENPQHVWIALSGYDNGNKVYYSSNAGATWTNVSGTLPNVPVNTIVYENVSTNNRLYIGTDIGVFTKDDVSGDWTPFMTGLPNVMVHELEINYSNYKIYAATYGRNVWQSDLADFITPTLNIDVAETSFCPEESFNVSYTASGEFIAGNIFTAQLSDASGSFALPTPVGSLTSTALTGIISCNIPATAYGTSYRMRVVSSSPTFTGTDNGTNITVSCAIPSGLNEIVITGNSANLEWDATECADSYSLQYKAVVGGTWTTVTSTTPSFLLTGLTPNTLYQWKVSNICVTTPHVETSYSTTSEFTTGQSTIEEILDLNGFSIYPNPFSTSTTLQFNLNDDKVITINLIDISGKLVQVINNEKLSAGNHSFEIGRNNLSKGVYTLQFISDNNSAGVNLVID